MTLSSRHRIQNSSHGGLRPSTLPLGHGGSPQYWLSHVNGEETFFVSFKSPRPGRYLYTNIIGWTVEKLRYIFSRLSEILTLRCVEGTAGFGLEFGHHPHRVHRWPISYSCIIPAKYGWLTRTRTYSFHRCVFMTDSAMLPNHISLNLGLSVKISNYPFSMSLYGVQNFDSSCTKCCTPTRPSAFAGPTLT